MKQHHIIYKPVPHETFVAVDREIDKNRALLSSYLEQLFWWNQRVNLVSRDVSRETVWEHIRHSLLVMQITAYQEASLVVDAGTGGGLPGLPLGLIYPEKSFVLNDIVTKKVLAVKQMIQKLKLSHISTYDTSVAELKLTAPFLLLSKHAFKINDLYHLTAGQPWTSMVFYKGIAFEEELAGIETPLSIVAYDLYKESNNSFYKDKALIHLTRNEPPDS